MCTRLRTTYTNVYLHLQDKLGDIVYAQLPEPDTEVEKEGKHLLLQRSYYFQCYFLAQMNVEPWRA
jgi:hypothetical protein